MGDTQLDKPDEGSILICEISVTVDVVEVVHLPQ